MLAAYQNFSRFSSLSLKIGLISCFGKSGAFQPAKPNVLFPFSTLYSYQFLQHIERKMWSTILLSIIETNHGNEDTVGNSDGGGNNKQQSTKSSGGNGDGIGDDDSNGDDDENEGGGGVGGSAALAVAAGQQWVMRSVARLVARQRRGRSQ